ncbi:glycoside hydrolase family 79 protein [Exidia glandulosa HHB12029]|uniref:Glycoside hydrolase family 79 protein n=1 Tax=Exidia glandulosa HHB12029 TaxID=1314781 RepID=A0A165PPK5_EXIGL|nr:glycoside hydrolase family 79 protein [Exidia glandulosa HHB12029]
MLPSLVSLALSAAVRVAHAQVSIYDYPIPLPHEDGPYDGWEAYDPTEIEDPPLPVPPPPLDFVIEVDRSGNPQAGIQTPGAFMGISIEMSLSEPIIGPNASYLRPQFLNLMATVKERAGPPVLRMGGNSQEKAGLVDQLPGGASVAKFAIGPTGFTNTPTLSYTIDLIKALRAASDLLQIKWFVGIPMNTTDPPRLEIVEQGESVMGEYLWGWQLGNEPDLYVSHNYRTEDYTIESYLDEFEKVVNAITANSKIKVSNNIGGPGVCCVWRLDDLIFQHNYFERFKHVLNSLIIQVRHKHYPYDNCDRGRYDPQQKMNEYMQHNFALKFANGYQNAVRASLAAGLPVILLETNTASCNGFLGLSDAFSGALWGMDLGLTLAANNFTHMMLHLGGQAAWYNPFMSPPHNASAPFMWTVGPVMYTIVAMAEALGKTNTARVADLNANGGNDFTPAYMIYENNQPARVVLINYMSDPTGAHDYTARIASGGSQVWVRYMLAPYMASKRNITWAGQSFGHYFESDGILRGQHQTDIIPCTGGVCPVRVPAPSIALVFLTEPVFVPEDAEAMSETFMTSFTTKRYNTAAVPAAALQTSNGLNAEARKAMGKSSTSSGRWREEHGGARVLAPQFTLHIAAAVAELALQRWLRM